MNNLLSKVGIQMNKSEELSIVIKDACLLTPPSWILRDLVAVNPFLGYLDRPITKVHQVVENTLGASLLPRLEVFREMFTRDSFGFEEIESALVEVRNDYPNDFKQENLTLPNILAFLTNNKSEFNVRESRVQTLADAVDLRLNTAGRWRTAIHVDISRYCSTRFDQGVALWRATDNLSGLFVDWRTYALNSFAMHARGLKQFRELVRSLPENPFDAIAQIITRLDIDFEAESYFASLLGDIPGWAGFIRQQAWEKGHLEIGELPDLLAIRLAYDLALFLDPELGEILRSQAVELPKIRNPSETEVEDTLIRLILLRAAELRVKNDILSELSLKHPLQQETRPLAQAVFCIDVRSEILRRHIDLVNPSIQTFGFAGFFGLPIGIRDQSGNYQNQCPVLLSSSVPANDLTDDVEKFKSVRKLLLVFSKSAVSCFNFVETLGFFSFFSMFRGLFANCKSNDDGLTKVSFESQSLEQRLSLATGILKNLGLKAPFGRIIFLCGHESRPTNNPQAAALGCGACGGHSGRANSILAAELLNDPLLRPELAKLGWVIPEDTVVVAGVHETVADSIKILSEVPRSHAEDFLVVQNSFRKAEELTRLERSTRLWIRDFEPENNFARRQNDISETRPEWGLAGNAAFIAGRSSLYRGANLKGRVFLHHYEEELDCDNSVLETILTAPVVVASWINLQYFASTVDPEKFGSGNKTIHNILGGVGVICGNDGDLAVGLSHQSVHDGKNIQHEPVRLQVFIQAKKERIVSIVQKHSFLQDLVGNGWILLNSISESEGTLRVEEVGPVF